MYERPPQPWQQPDKHKDQEPGLSPKSAVPAPPATKQIPVVGQWSQPETIPAELAQRLQESAQLARQTPDQAMMTPDLRNMLTDIRTNDPIYLHFRWLAGEHPLGFEEYGTTGNTVALRKRP